MLKNKQPPTVSIRATMQQQQLASARNRRLAQQMENRPSVQAALKLKQVSGNIPVPFFLPTPPFPSVPTACTVAPDDSSPRQSTTSTPFTGLLPLRWEAGDDVATTRWQNNFLWGENGFWSLQPLALSGLVICIRLFPGSHLYFNAGCQCSHCPVMEINFRVTGSVARN